HNVSLEVLEHKLEGDCYVVRACARVRTPDGIREDTDLGIVHLDEAKTGAQRANAMMKAITKSKRRVTLSLFGLGMTDESELEGLPNARPVELDEATGAILGDRAGADALHAAPADPPTADGPPPTGPTDPIEAERAAWLDRVHAAANQLKLSAKERAALWSKFCGEATPKHCDPAQLQALYTELAARPGR
ncbi:MAG: hypothetical protein L0027_16455, partial [Candidatus Rokubacteria bacterium]|nr:hypothetical protein [Candidatus Rokubacteria bacterium]